MSKIVAGVNFFWAKPKIMQTDKHFLFRSLVLLDFLNPAFGAMLLHLAMDEVSGHTVSSRVVESILSI